MYYVDLLNTLPEARYDLDGNCITCNTKGYCQIRADNLVAEVMGQLANKIKADPLDVLAWLIKQDEIGTMKDEIAEDLAQAYRLSLLEKEAA